MKRLLIGLPRLVNASVLAAAIQSLLVIAINTALELGPGFFAQPVPVLSLGVGVTGATLVWHTVPLAREIEAISDNLALETIRLEKRAGGEPVVRAGTAGERKRIEVRQSARLREALAL